MIRFILAISLTLLAAAGGYYFLAQRSAPLQTKPPEISAAKEKTIVKREDRKAEDYRQDIRNREAVNELDRNYR